MNIEQIVEILAERKGQNMRAQWKRSMKTRKGVMHKVEKLTACVVRAGMDYDNLKTVQEARESGALPAENAGLPWGRWLTFPFLIEHKGVHYVRMYPPSLDIAPEAVYLKDGEIVSKEDIAPLCLASEFPQGEPPKCFTIKANDLIAL